MRRDEANIADHGTSGALHLSYADTWERNLTDIFVAAKEVGMTVNKDSKFSLTSRYYRLQI